MLSVCIESQFSQQLSVELIFEPKSIWFNILCYTAIIVDSKRIMKVAILINLFYEPLPE